MNISNPFSKPFFISQVALVASDGGEIVAGILHLSVVPTTLWKPLYRWCRQKRTQESYYISETLALRISWHREFNRENWDWKRHPKLPVVRSSLQCAIVAYKLVNSWLIQVGWTVNHITNAPSSVKLKPSSSLGIREATKHLKISKVTARTPIRIRQRIHDWASSRCGRLLRSWCLNPYKVALIIAINSRLQRDLVINTSGAQAAKNLWGATCTLNHWCTGVWN